MTKQRIKKPTVMRNIVDVPQLESETANFVQEESTKEAETETTVSKKPASGVTKMVRQPDTQIAVDPILAQIIRDYESENEALQKHFSENLRAKNKALAKVLTMNALTLRVNCAPVWVAGTDILSVPVPDLVQLPTE